MPNEGDYITLLRYIIQHKPKSDDGEIIYTSDELRNFARILKINLGNPADFKYNLTKRYGEFPQDIQELGFNTIITKKRGIFALAKVENRYVELPKIPIEPPISSKNIPESVKPYLADDEQSLLSIMEYCNLLNLFLDEKCDLILSHYRTTYKSIQVEVDAFYICKTSKTLFDLPKDLEILIPVEAKILRKEKYLTQQQIIYQIEMVQSKYPTKNIICITSTLMLDNSILVLAFRLDKSKKLEILRAKRYKIEPSLW